MEILLQKTIIGQAGGKSCQRNSSNAHSLPFNSYRNRSFSPFRLRMHVKVYAERVFQHFWKNTLWSHFIQTDFKCHVGKFKKFHQVRTKAGKIAYSFPFEITYDSFNSIPMMPHVFHCISMINSFYLAISYLATWR